MGGFHTLFTRSQDIFIVRLKSEAGTAQHHPDEAGRLFLLLFIQVGDKVIEGFLESLCVYVFNRRRKAVQDFLHSCPELLDYFDVKAEGIELRPWRLKSYVDR